MSKGGAALVLLAVEEEVGQVEMAGGIIGAAGQRLRFLARPRRREEIHNEAFAFLNLRYEIIGSGG